MVFSEMYETVCKHFWKTKMSKNNLALHRVCLNDPPSYKWYLVLPSVLHKLRLSEGLLDWLLLGGLGLNHLEYGMQDFVNISCLLNSTVHVVLYNQVTNHSLVLLPRDPKRIKKYDSRMK